MKTSSFKIISVISLILIGTLALSIQLVPVKAEKTVQVYPKEITIEQLNVTDPSQVISVKENGGGLIVSVVQGKSVEIMFKARSTCTILDLFAIEDNGKTIKLFNYFPDYSDATTAGCLVNGVFTVEDKDYFLLFLSPGDDGKYGNLEREEFLAKYSQSIAGKTGGEIAQKIRTESVDVVGSGDLAGQKMLTVISSYPKVETIELGWNDETLEISGKTNLPSGKTIEWTFYKSQGESPLIHHFEIPGETTIRSDGSFQFTIDKIWTEEKGVYGLIIEVKEYGISEDFSMKLDPENKIISDAKQEFRSTVLITIKPKPTPASTPVPQKTSKPTPRPTLRPTPRPTPTPIKTIIATPINNLDIGVAVILAIVFLKKRKCSG